MAKEAFCPIHGPYDATLGACPYPHDSSKRPVPPTPLDEDDLPTDLGGYDQPTSQTAPPGFDDEGETEIPAHRRSGFGILDIEDEDETELPRRYHDDDVTELYETPGGGGPLAMLWVTEGPRRGKFYPIRPGTVIGRNKADLILDDAKVSGSHAKFTMEDDEFFIWDFGSANGTYVNGKRIREATLLEENDIVKIGETLFVVKLLDSTSKQKTSRVSNRRKSTKEKAAARSSKKS